MKYRVLGKTGLRVSEIGFGAWAIGGTWGKVNDVDSVKALEKAVDLGINFFDTADVYGDGKSERLIGKILKEHDGSVYVATKAGRRLNPHVAESYTYSNLKSFVERSLKNLGVSRIDLLQLHSPPHDVYYNPDVFDALDRLVSENYIGHYGVSVEKVEEAIRATDYPNLGSVQIIFNIFRQRPKELFFQIARNRNVGIICRVPLASGLLTGKFTGNEDFEEDDHRRFNRHGEAFDRGETFAGIDFSKGVSAVNELEKILPANYNMTQFALKWILMHDAVSVTIPGAKNVEQVQINASASDLPPIHDDLMERIDEIYNERIRRMVHYYW